ncbi:MAG: glycosyl transferase family protein [Nitrosomonadales bacterium]|nr:glycosyl transferase family protein [Nitrosomonadales bacterium]
MEHPFARFIQILGKGQRGARDLTQQEAEQAMAMILAGQTEAMQLGAFLMLMRVKEETPAELAGFVSAARASLTLPQELPTVALDWAAYAGKRRQLPWFVLSALLLASHRIPVLMHGLRGGISDRVYAPQALAALGITPSGSIVEAAEGIRQRHFAFVPIDVLSADLDYILGLKPILGLRSPVHTIVRMLNPFAAQAAVMGIFHPGYDETHQQAAALLGDHSMAVFKGEGGEAERNPDAACKVRMVLAGAVQEEEWPALFDSRHIKDDSMDVARLGSLWRDEAEDEYGLAAVLSTAAIALRTLGRAQDMASAQALAAELWATRDIGYLTGAAH